jgi:hypothetical protein
MSTLPVFAQHREEQMILPSPFDAKVLPGVTLLPETGSQQQRTAWGVVRQAGSLDPMKAKPIESEG